MLFGSLIAAINNLIVAISLHTQALNNLTKVLSLKRLGPIHFRILREENAMLVCVLNLPALSSKDVVKRVITYKVNESEDSVTIELDGDDLHTLVSPEIQLADNDVISGSLVDIDDADNSSPAREFSFVARDTIAPPQPGELSLSTLREEDTP